MAERSRAGLVAGATAQTKFLRFPQVRALVGLSRSTVWRLMVAGKFPRPYALSEHTVGWLLSDVEGWMQERIADDKRHSEEAGS